MADIVSVEEVIRFRLAAHGLIERLSEDKMLSAAGRCGVQNSPPGSALLALHARVRGITADTLSAAVEDKRLVQTWAMRGAPYFFPTPDFSVFTTGVLPTTEAALRHFIIGVQQSVDRLDMSVTDAVELCHNEIGDVLAGGRPLEINQLGAELAHRISGGLTTKQRSVWNSEGPCARGQPVGEAVVHFCIRILTLRQVVCLAPRENNTAPFVLVDDWLDRPAPDPDAPAARAELLRRYLRCYGPSTRGNFAAWLGLTAADVGPWWDLVAEELARVDFGGTAWILIVDIDALRSSPSAKGVRLLPPRDPYTQMRDRDTIVDRSHHRDVWKAIGEPGTVLIDGTIAGIWRPRKEGRALTLTITAFTKLSARDKKALHTEAEQIAPLRGASAFEVRFDTF